MVARFVRDEEAVGSNPATPTGNRRDRLVPAIFYRSALLGLTTRCGVAPQISGHEACLISGLKDKKSWSEPDLSALRCEKVWFKVVGGQL